MSTRLKWALLVAAALAALGLGGVALAGATGEEGGPAAEVRESVADVADGDADDAREPRGHDDAGEPPERPVDGESAARARSAAVKAAGGGSASEVERTDERDGYKVQVDPPRGEQVEVQLDGDFRKVSIESDAD